MGKDAGNKKATMKGTGSSGNQLDSKDPIVLAAVDGHMHIQSGHVGTVPFVLGMKLPFGVREKTQDISFKELNLKLDRKFLDGVGEFYENTYQPYLKDLAKKSDVLAEKANALSGTIEEKKRIAQKLIFSMALKISKVIQKAFLAYESAVDTDYKLVVDLMTENLEVIQGAISRGEDLAKTGKVITRLERRLGAEVSRSVQRRADMLTGICIGIATMIIDFHLRMIEDMFDATLELLAALKQKVKGYADEILKVFASVTSLRKEIAKVICWDLVQIIMEGAKEVNKEIDEGAEYAQAAATTLHLELEALSDFFEKYSSNEFGEFLAIQRKKTYEIADTAVKGHAASMVERAKEAGAEPENVFGPIIALPMDMDYSHLDRFKKDDNKAKVYQLCKKRYWMFSGVGKKAWVPGVRTKQDIPMGAIHTLLAPDTTEAAVSLLKKAHIVEEEKGNFYYFNSRLSGVKEGMPFWVHDSEFKLYEHWKVQKRETIKTVKAYPWSMVPLYHFEPRRYSGACDEAFQYIMHKNVGSGSGTKERLFIGFKVYPNLGYKPLDPWLPSLDTMYSFCCDNDVPVMTHGSPNGAFTHDRPIYYEHDRSKNRVATAPAPDMEQMKHVDKEIYYFMQEYASPWAWETVLKEHTSLKLCIAHFGGSDERIDSTKKKKKYQSGWEVAIDPDKHERGEWNTKYWNQKIMDLMQTYDNLYTDLSCHEMSKPDIIKNLAAAICRWPDLRKRILFGTDWYMTELSKLSYQDFVYQMKDAVDQIDSIVRRSGKVPDSDPLLWQWLTEINPFRFYRFDWIAKEYSGELTLQIKKDKAFTKSQRDELNSQIEDSKKLIYSISKKLKQLGELPDAVTKE